MNVSNILSFVAVPCYKRVKHVDSHQEEFEKIVNEEDGDGGWVDTHHFAGRWHCSVPVAPRTWELAGPLQEPQTSGAFRISIMY